MVETANTSAINRLPQKKVFTSTSLELSWTEER
jgi:hypothetical protein